MAEPSLYIALAGNPNCGKTTLFNELTGSNGYVGNWAGVTVEKKLATYRRNKDVTFIDLPGIYSLSPYSPEEKVSSDYLIKDRPDAVIDLVDVTNLERNLYLTTQVLETGLPVVIGLNMCDLLKKRGDKIDVERLSKLLGAPCVEVSALRATNTDKLVETAIDYGRSHRLANCPHIFTAEVEEALQKIAALIEDKCEKQHLRWYSIRLFERDLDSVEALNLSDEELGQIDIIVSAIEESLDDDSESIITSQRYDWIGDVVSECVVKAPKKLTMTEKIDRIVTNRILGLPIFILAMTFVYFVSTSSSAIGTSATNFVNDGLFGEGWYADDGLGFVLTGKGPHKEAYDEAVKEYDLHNYDAQVKAFIAAAEEKGVNVEGVQEAADAKEPTENDQAILHNFEDAAAAAGVVVKDMPIFDSDGNFVDTNGEAVKTNIVDGKKVPELEPGQKLQTINVTAADFTVACDAKKPDHSQFGMWIDGIPTVVSNWLESAGASQMVISMVVDGAIAGVGSVLGFLPQILVLFMFLTFMEDCGYMSRVAFVMDRVFRKFGLSGKSFIPMLVSAGCAVPGIMATKTIENENDRRMTIMTVPFIPCSAKLPIIALLMGALVGGSSAWWVAPMFYFMGVAAVIVSGIILKKTKRFAGDPTPFIMELPEYHIPRFSSWLLHVWERIKAFITKAGTIIFAASILVWFLSNFGTATWEGGSGAFGYLPSMAGVPEEFMDFSILAAFGNAIKFLFAPLGFANWKAVSATLMGLIAKENLVSTYSILYGLGELSEESTVLWSLVNQSFTDAQGLHTGALVAFMAFNMLCAPCFAAMGAMRKQLDDRGWWGFAIAYETGFAWIVALMINQFYDLIVFKSFTIWTACAFAAAGVLLYLLFRKTPQYDR